MDQHCLMEDAFDSEVWIGAICGSDVQANWVYTFGYHTWNFSLCIFWLNLNSFLFDWNTYYMKEIFLFKLKTQSSVEIISVKVISYDSEESCVMII